MKYLVFFLEEPSAEEMLRGVVGRIIGNDVVVRYIVFRGKQDLLKNIRIKLSGWRCPDTAFVIMCDQDNDDCKRLKGNIASLCDDAGRRNILIRIACRELESFFLGDLKAVKNGLRIDNSKMRQESQKYRDPDSIIKPSEELSRVTNKAYTKVAGSRAIAPYLDLDNNRSNSFITLVKGLRSFL